MRFTSAALAASLASGSLVQAYSSQWDLHNRVPKKPVQRVQSEDTPPPTGLGDEYLNAKTQQYVVNGSSLPFVNFDAGDSFAGHMSISNNATDENALFFWFWPSANADAGDEIVIWLNGGPGCSSLDGFLQENGPIEWQSGTYRPVRNPYSWTKLTNMVWIDQPIGTGLSTAAKGAPQKVKNETVVAEQFMGFWKNFMTTFNLTGRKVYITGESYAGQYIPYIAWYMLMAKNTDYYNVKGIQINDPSIGNGYVLTEAPAVWHMNAFSSNFGLNSTTVDSLNQRNVECGYDQFMRDALTFPPLAKFPAVPAEAGTNKCQLWGDIIEAVTFINPCFNIYHLTDFCPFLWDTMGFPSEAQEPFLYFNLTSVQRALNIKTPIDYMACGNPNLGLNNGQGDQSLPSAFLPLPHVIDQTQNVIIGSGTLDYLLLTNGTLATIQNMTWGGSRGFQRKPSDLLFVPYHSGFNQVFNGGPAPVIKVAGSGYLGTTHKERGLTWVEVNHSGHEQPQYTPGAAFRELEYLLGRISNLTAIGSFTVPL